MLSSDPIREWFERHREDYCDCVGSPPRAWAEYMSLLLDERDELQALPDLLAQAKTHWREALQERDEARKLARQATNGWACYATREVEHDDIARIHRVLDAMEAE